MSDWKWKVQYSAEVEGVYFEKPIIFFDTEFEMRVKISFLNVNDSSKGRIDFLFLDFNSDNKEESKQKTKIIVDNFINIMADRFLLKSTCPYISYISENGGEETAIGRITLKKPESVNLNANHADEIIKSLGDKSYLDFLANNGQKNLFKAIMFSENKVGSFVAMYSILMEIIIHHGIENGKGQAKVDDFIRAQSIWNVSDDKNSELHKDRQGIPYKETKYTWLRNQIGHTNLKTNYLEVEREIENSYADLVELVRCAINKYIK
ncbi:hypothetical protein [Exiguobacterium sp. PHA03]|uniref:hypothetical protein n=1 Tax=Exiguobacterium sp. PHA03 TaxID=3064895 RepID=UPI0035C245C4